MTAIMRVDKRTYHPLGWTKLYDREVEVKLTPKQITITRGPQTGMRFDRETGQQLNRIDRHSSYSHSITSVDGQSTRGSGKP